MLNCTPYTVHDSIQWVSQTCYTEQYTPHYTMCYQHYDRRVWQIPFFFDRIQIPNIIRFSEITKYRISNTIRHWENLNTEYQILFVIEKIQIPNTKYYSLSRKFEYRIRIVLFGLTIWIPNTKYPSVYNILEKWIQNKDICPIQDILFWKYVKLFGQVFGPAIPIPEYYSGCQKNSNTEYQILFGIEKIRIPNMNTTIW